MESVRKLLLAVCFCFALLFVFAENPHTRPASTILSEKADSVFADNTIYAGDFIQPQGTHQLVGASKSEHHPVLKFLMSVPYFTLQAEVLKPVFIFHFQDIDRCEKVSLLLFPYHFFW